MTKRILILGAGEAQLNLVKASKDLGYYTIVCDTRDYMPAAKLADKLYKYDYRDKEKIYEIAKLENIDGVISNSEIAMSSVSYLVDMLNFPGNTSKSLNKIASKSEFRKMQLENKIFAPQSFQSDNLIEIIEKTKTMSFPIIIKPCQSSGSRGTAKIMEFCEREIQTHFLECSNFSRNKVVVVEEFVEMSSLDTINADIFVVNDEIIWDGWYGNIRSPKHKFIPMTKVLPPLFSEEQKKKIIKDVTTLIKASGVTLGEFNVETYFDDKGNLFIIEINPRQGGDNIPSLIEQHTGVDLTKLLVSLTVGDESYYKHLKQYTRKNNYVLLHVVFSEKTGKYQGLYISDEIKQFVKYIKEYNEYGDMVYDARNAEDSIAYVDLEFNTREEQIKYLKVITELIYPVVR